MITDRSAVCRSRSHAVKSGVDKFAEMVKDKDQSRNDKFSRIKVFFDLYGVASCPTTCFIFWTPLANSQKLFETSPVYSLSA